MNKLINESDYFLAWLLYWLGGTLGGLILGAVAGGVVGFLLGMAGVPLGAIKLICGLIGLLIGAVLSYILFRWLVAVMIVRKAAARMASEKPAAAYPNA